PLAPVRRPRGGRLPAECRRYRAFHKSPAAERCDRPLKSAETHSSRSSGECARRSLVNAPPFPRSAAVRIHVPAVVQGKIPRTHRFCPALRRAEDHASNDIGPQPPWRAFVYPFSLGGFVTTAPCLLRTSDKTFAISTAARAASVPRLILFSRQRARAWFSLSKLSTALITGTPCSMAQLCIASVTERLRFCAC